MKTTIIYSLLLFILFSCNKTVQQKVVNKWEGKWSIIAIEGYSDITEDTPFGSVEFFDDGSAELKMKNFDYDNSVDMGLVIEFYIKPQRTPHLSTDGYVVKETNAGYEYYKTIMPCPKGEMSYFFKRGFWGRKKTATLEMQAFPECLFKSTTWTIKKMK